LSAADGLRRADPDSDKLGQVGRRRSDDRPRACRLQCAGQCSERGINADINATLGRNWQLGGTENIEAQSMRREASGYADQVLNNCMRAKGFTKEG